MSIYILWWYLFQYFVDTYFYFKRAKYATFSIFGKRATVCRDAPIADNFELMQIAILKTLLHYSQTQWKKMGNGSNIAEG